MSFTTSGGEMSAKRLAIFFVLVLILFCSAAAQDFSDLWLVNQLSATAGRTFVSTQTIDNDSSSLDPRIHFGNPASFEFNYGRRLKTREIFGVFAELPVAIYPQMDLNTYQNQIPNDIGALFVTPSAAGEHFLPGLGEPVGERRWRLRTFPGVFQAQFL